MPPELSIVIPAYNEAARIADTVRAWSGEAHRLRIEHEILVCDDGSTDETPSVLAALVPEANTVRVRRHDNRGHGPTILDGYRHAAGSWVLQVDADDEVGPGPFEAFWNERHRYDLLIGARRNRRLALARRLLTLASRCAVGVLFGWAVADVNSPYRLIRRSMLVELLPALPEDMFAPNVAMSGLAVRRGFRILERPVLSRPVRQRRDASWRAVSAARLSFVQLLAVSRRRS